MEGTKKTTEEIKNESAENQKNDLTIVGVGKIKTGSYGEVKSAGVCVTTGEVAAESLRASGTFTAKADVTAKQGKCSGVAVFKKDCRIEDLKVSGSLTVKGALKSQEIKVDGSLSAPSVEAETIDLYGTLKVKGELSVGTLDLCSRDSVIETLHADEVKISLGKWKWMPFHGMLVPKIGVVECTDFHAEGVKAETVSCRNAVIGKHCKIGTLEYSGELTMDPDASVVSVRKVD